MIVTRVERSGRDSDQQWLEIQAQKEREHRMQGGNNFFKVSLREDEHRTRFDCAFMKMDGGLKDPAGYQIITYD